MGTQKRGRYWYSRTRVPSELVPLVGQREVVRSLRTSSYREADPRIFVGVPYPAQYRFFPCDVACVNALSARCNMLSVTSCSRASV